MTLNIAFILLCGFANRWRGGGIVKGFKYRKLTASLVIGLAYGGLACLSS